MTDQEFRCVVCGQPCADHTPFRYWWAAYWRHRVYQPAGLILGRLPLGAAEPD